MNNVVIIIIIFYTLPYIVQGTKLHNWWYTIPLVCNGVPFPFQLVRQIHQLYGS